MAGLPESATDEDERVSLRHTFAERHLAVSTMDRPLRIATAGTVAGLLGAAVLIALRGLGGPEVSLGTIANVQMTLSVPLFISTLVLLSLGFGYLVAGALFAHRIVAIVGILCLTVLIGWTTGVLGIGGFSVVLPEWAHWGTRLLLGAIGVIAVSVIVIRHGRHGDAVEDRTLRVIVLSAICALFGGYFIVLWLASPVINGLTLFPQSVSFLMTNIALLATPMLLIAAIDFGEWGELSGQRLASAQPFRGPFSRVPWQKYVAPVVLCVMAGVFGWVVLAGTPTHRLWLVGQALLLMGIVVVVFIAGGAALRVTRFRWPKSLSFAAIFSVCAIITWVGAASVTAVSGAFAVPPLAPVSANGDFTTAANVRSVTGISGFTALVPVGWNVTQNSAHSIDLISNTFPDGMKVILVIASPPQSASVRAFAPYLGAQPKGSIIIDGAWQELLVTPKGGGSGTIWFQDALGSGGKPHLAYGTVTGHAPDSGLRQLEAVIRTFRPTGQPPATLATVLAINGNAQQADASAQRHNDIIQSLGTGFVVVSALIALAVMIVFRRRVSPTWRLAVLFFCAVATITVVASVSSLGRVAFGPGSTWPSLSKGGILVSTGLFGLAALWIASRRQSGWAVRLPGALAGIVGAVIGLSIINQIYDVALQASQVAAWAAILILVAVGWDIMMSGETMTNGSSTVFPRSSRVIAFFGYVLVLAAAMVFYSGQLSAASGHRVTESFFEPESITQGALFRIALPLLLVLFLLHLFGSSVGKVDSVEAATTSEPDREALSSK